MTDQFADRHIGTDSVAQLAMLEAVGYDSVDALMDAAVPTAIRLAEGAPSTIPAAATEREALAELRALAAHNTVRRSMIGLGYYDTITPAVIQRNVLENPSWYTAYTPYQPEISQGRLEALINFQTMVTDLTGLHTANASMLDEGTAVVEGMLLARRASGAASHVFVVDADAVPADQGAAARPRRGGRHRAAWSFALADDAIAADAARRASASPSSTRAPRAACGTRRPSSRPSHAHGGLAVVAADLLALTLVSAPGEFGADVAVGTTQRFGVPMGFGGPHAGYMAVRDGLERQLPGRLVGVSQDADGLPRVPAHPADARAAHPPREGDEQHLHRAGAAGRHGVDVRGLPRPGRPHPDRARGRAAGRGLRGEAARRRHPRRARRLLRHAHGARAGTRGRGRRARRGIAASCCTPSTATGSRSASTRSAPSAPPAARCRRSSSTWMRCSASRAVAPFGDAAIPSRCARTSAFLDAPGLQHAPQRDRR